MRSVVVLPQPDGPTSVTNSRSAISMFRSCTAVTVPNRLTTPSSTTFATVDSAGAFYAAHASDDRRSCGPQPAAAAATGISRVERASQWQGRGAARPSWGAARVWQLDGGRVLRPGFRDGP